MMESCVKDATRRRVAAAVFRPFLPGAPRAAALDETSASRQSMHRSIGQLSAPQYLTAKFNPNSKPPIIRTLAIAEVWVG